MKYSNFSLFGVCFDQACRDQQKANADLAASQAAAIAALNKPTTETGIGKYIAYGIGASALLIAVVLIANKVKK